MNTELTPSVPLFAAVSRSDRKRLAALADELEVPAGAILTQQGEYAREFRTLLREHPGVAGKVERAVSERAEERE